MIRNYNGEEKVKELLRGHFISEEAYRHLKNDDFDNFVIEREKEIKRQIIDQTGIQN